MTRHIVTVIILLLMLPSNVAGQKSDYSLFENISFGAEATVISCFLQDTQGLIWIGSNKGLFSYDGYSSQPHFAFGERSNTRIHCGEVVDSTYLYMGADNGLLIYNYRTDTYEEPITNSPTDIRALVSHNDKIWLGTINGLYTYSPQTKQLNSVSQGLPHQTIYSLLRTSANELYVGTYNGCCRYNPNNKQFETISLPAPRGKSNLFVNSLLEDPSHRYIWIGTEGWLYRYTIADGSIKRIDDFHNNSVKSLAMDGDNRLLVGTDNGLYVYTEDEPLIHVVHDSRNLRSLSNNIIWSIFADSQYNIWLGTDYGISMLRHNRLLYHVPVSQITGTGEGNQFYSMLCDARGTYWFGGANGLIRFNLDGDITSDVAWYKMGDTRHPLPHNRVRHLYQDREQQLWVSTDGGISRYDLCKKQLVHYNIVDSTSRYNANWAYGLLEDKEGKLWIAACLGGVFVVDKKNLINSPEGVYKAERCYSTHNGLSGMFINQMIMDQQGNVWVLLYNSVNSIEKINPATGKVTPIDIGNHKGERAPSFLLCDEDGYIWIGFSGGVMRVDPNNSNAITTLQFDDYNHYGVLYMTEAEGRIWVSTTDGLWCVDRNNMEVKRLNITNKRFTSMYYHKSTGELFLGTTDGFAVSSPEALLAEPSEQPLILTALYVNNELYPSNITKQQSIRYTTHIKLNHYENNLAFELSDLPYSLEEKNKIVYRLNGADGKWNLLQPNTNRITYSNLSYGKYQLVVSKLNSNGKPSDSVFTLDIQIVPPFYYTYWAKTVYAMLCLVLMVWTVNFFRVKNRLKLERMEKEKIMEQSKAKMEFFTNLSHDLKTPLGMIIAPISRMIPTIKNAQEKKQLEQVHRNAMKLNSLIHQGLDLNRVDSGNNALLILSQIELVSFVRGLLALHSEGKSREKQLTLHFHTDSEKIYIQMDAIKLESILDNLLSNAVKYTPAGGTITFSINQCGGGKEINISVSDTGIGVSKQDQPYLFQRFYQSPKTAGEKEGTGIGLYLVKTYTELHGGSVQLSSEEGTGTTVTLCLPVVSKEQELIEIPIDLDAEQTQIQQPETEDGSVAYTDEAPEDAPLVLIVDDSHEVTEFVYQILHSKYRCRIAKDGKEGAEMAKELLPQLIITDMVMPVMDGLEMVRGLKKHVPTSTIPIILLTGKNDKDTELASIQLNIEAFISKPFEPDILIWRVQQLLEAQEAHEAKARIEVIATPKEIEAVSYDEKFLSNIILLIEEHISDTELNVNALCEWTNTNNKQMYRKIKQLTGMTPVEYIKSIRMKKAAMLLKQQKFTVAEVMYMVGFSNHSYFSKCFQAQFGVTPKQYV